MTITRRYFLKGGGVAMLGFSAMPTFLTRALQAATEPSKKVLVVIFQRGAMDGLNAVVPYGERNYYSMRPSIAIPAPNGGQAAALDLDGFFGVHPSLAPLVPLFHNKQLAIVHAAGSPDNTRSHFDAQDYMESGTPGVKSTDDGWLNRALQKENKEDKDSPFKAIALGTALPRTLAGPEPAVAISNIADFGVGGRNGGDAAVALGKTFESMYSQSVDSVLHGTGSETFEAVKMLKAADPAKYQPAAGIN